MHRKMKHLSVRTDRTEYLIYIEQPTYDPGNEPDTQILLGPDQIPTLIQWLQEAKEQFEGLEQEQSNGLTLI
jgi:hypothetical protein